jgi:hypothetical protein
MDEILNRHEMRTNNFGVNVYDIMNLLDIKDYDLFLKRLENLVQTVQHGPNISEDYVTYQTCENILRKSKSKKAKNVIFEIDEMSAGVVVQKNDLEPISWGRRYNWYFGKDNKRVLYLAYVGVHNNGHVFKCGVVSNLTKHSISMENRIYPIFDVILFHEDHIDESKKIFDKNVSNKKLLQKITYWGVTHNCIFCANSAKVSDVITKFRDANTIAMKIKHDEKMEELKSEIAKKELLLKQKLHDADVEEVCDILFPKSKKRSGIVEV